jgi:DNA helicase-2/ATP-dependent DNA helicase PcrA
MAIACVYCSGVHDTAGEVRDCWRARGEPEADGVVVPDDDGTDAGAAYDAADEPTPAPRAVRSVAGVPDRVAPRRAAPPTPPAQPRSDRAVAAVVARAVAAPMLGRFAVVAARADAPAGWEDADRLDVADEQVADPERRHRLVEELRARVHARRPTIVVVGSWFDLDPAERTDLAPHLVGARHEFLVEELHHLVAANAIDLRDPAAPRWALVDRAVALGARVGGAADVVLPDGAEVWLDGGPVRLTPPIGGRAVLHAVAVEHGSLRVPEEGAEHPASLAELAPDQRAAVEHTGGAARIIAPAGSGKTRVLTERARHLLTRWRLPAGAVCLVAFNKRAQEEMTERTADLPGLQIRTLNALALAIVNGTAPFAPQPRRFTTIDEPEVRRILGRLVPTRRLRNTDPLAPWIEALGQARLALLDPTTVDARYAGEVVGFADVYPRYLAELERAGAVDFDDQVRRALQVLLADPAARRAAQRSCRVLLVDEFQDLTPAHLLLVRLLAAPGGAVFGVGDDDQTIYGYNGADPGSLIDFATLFPGAQDHPLEVNYRCPAGVVEVADRLLRHNRRRVPKTIRAASEDPDGWAVRTSDDPVADTVAAVRAALEAGASPGEVAVLARVNAVLAPVQVALAGAGVPHAGGVGLEFLDRTAVRAVLAWFRVVLADDGERFASEDLAEIVRRPSRSMAPRVAEWVTEQGDAVGLRRLADRLTSPKDATTVGELVDDLLSLRAAARRGATTRELLDLLVDDVGLAGAVATLDATRRGTNRASQGDDLTAIGHLADLHPDPGSFEPWLRRQLGVRPRADGLTLATVHRVKGLEWPHVVVHLADAEQYPHRLAEDVEEERRLFHVAITRARQAVTIVTGPRPSSFVAELTTEPPELVTSRPGVGGRAGVAPGAAASSTGRAPRPAGRSDRRAPARPTEGAAGERFERLRTWRKEAADGKPAYTVFTDATLAELAERRPTTLAQLARISGVGPAKLERYGAEVLRVLADDVRD